MKQVIVSFLALMLAVTSTVPAPALAQSLSLSQGMTSLDEPVSVPNGWRQVSISVDNESVRNVLKQLADKGQFNLVMDESVVGNVTIELSQVSLNQALQSVAAMTDVLLLKQSGNIYLAITRKTAQEKGLSRQLSKVINISYSNANRVADVLNRSLFASTNASNVNTGTGGQVLQKVRADSRTNSIIVIGTAREIELAEAAVSKLDLPRQSKIFYLSHANALDVATMLSSSVYNDGTSLFRLGGAGGSSTGSSTGSTTGGAGTAMPSTLRVEKQDVSEGTGVNNFGSSNSGGGGSSGSGGLSSGFSSQVTLRGFVKSTDTASVSPEGAIVIPDTRQNSIMIMGTAEQIAIAESLIPTIDAQLPQVSIEASLVEVTEDGVKELSTRVGLGGGQFSGGFNNIGIPGVENNPGIPSAYQTNGGIIGAPSNDPTETEAFARSTAVFSSNPFSSQSDYALQIRALLNKQKAKILANPTVVATHDTESIISIVDEVVRRVTTQLDTSGFATQTVEIGEAGIVMDILPKVGEDGTVSLRLRPSVTTIRQETRDAQGNLITLLSKRDLLTQNVRMKDGETLVIGGLIHESNTSRLDKLPVIGDLPIVGAMFRASQLGTHRSELVLLITPHILSKTRLTPVNSVSPLNSATGSVDVGGAQ